MRHAGQPASEDPQPSREALPVDLRVSLDNGQGGRISLSFEQALHLAVEIICAYVSSSFVARRDLPSVIESVGDTMRTFSTKSVNNSKNNSIATAPAEDGKAPVPAVPVNQSVFDDYIICLEDGSRYKSLTRHLKSSYEMGPDEYRAKWNLPAHYPMTAPAYSRRRSKISKELELERRVRLRLTPTTRSKEELR